MARILRGEIYWADLNPVKGSEQAGMRPVIILSQDIFNRRSGTVIGMAITSQSQRAGFPLTLELTAFASTQTILGQDQSDPNTRSRAAWEEDRNCYPGRT